MTVTINRQEKNRFSFFGCWYYRTQQVAQGQIDKLLSVQSECGCELNHNKNVRQPYLHPSSHPSVPVPDVLPDASNCCTLGLTFKKVCQSLSGYYKSLRLLAFSTVPTCSKHKVLSLLTSVLPKVTHSSLHSTNKTIATLNSC